MFADDTTTLEPIDITKNLDIQIEENMEQVTNICDKMDLEINRTKTIHMNFTNTMNNKQQTMINQRTTHTKLADSTCFLGITIDKHLNWEAHIDNLHKKLSSILYALRRLRQITNKETSKIAYHALFESQIRFGIIAWGAASQTQLQRILVLQKKAIRIIEQLQCREHCKDHFKSNNILSLISLYIFETISQIKKSPHTKRIDQHKHNIRIGHNLDLPHHRLTKTSKAPNIMGIKLFNRLPETLTSISSTHKFTKQLKQYLINRPYYTLSEFFEEHSRHT